jgi:HlyD family secretion protein
MKKSFIAIGLFGGAMVCAGAWWLMQSKTDAPTYKTAKIERGNLQATVSASGAVNPVTQVSVGTQISGQIKELYVDFNSEVRAGQLIALIDPETYEYRVRQAQADLDAAKAAHLTQQAGLSKAKVEADDAARDADRKKQLVDKQFIAQSEADKALAVARSLAETVKVVQAQIQSAIATVAQRDAAFAQARIDLTRTKITSPVSGIVIKRAIEKGQTVAASLQSPELFVIAQNLRDMQVDASIDESDVGRIKSGQRATFTVDAFPGQTFEGTVNQVRKAAQNVANVVTYVAVVGFANSDGRLLPGMTANVRVVTDSREGVLKIPNAALRVKIAGVEPAPPSGTPAQAPASGASSTSFNWIAPAFAQPSGGAPGALRERLVEGLQLSSDQQGKLDAVLGELRPKFMALREMSDEQRVPAREKVTTEMRAKVNAFLTSEQKTKYLAMQAASPQANSAVPPKGIASVKPSASSLQADAIKPPAGGVAPAITGQGPLVDVRNRLVAELQMPQAQADKLDAIYAANRPKFATLRDLPEAERGKARDRISADIRAQIETILTPAQKPRYAELVAQAASRQGANARGRIYLQGEGGKPVAYNVRLGITDGTSTELMVMPNSPNADKLIEGATVITSLSASPSSSSAPKAPSGPRLPF